MRFLEHHARAILGGIDTPLAKSVVPICVNNVADWYFTESDVEEYSLRDQFPSTTMPFPATFFEYRVPQSWKVRGDNGEWVSAEVNNGGCYIGILMLQERLPDGYSGNSLEENRTISQVRMNLKEDPGCPRFRQYMAIYAGTKDDYTLATTATQYVDEEGKMMGGPFHDVDPMIIEKGKHKSDIEAYSEFIRVYAFPMFFATSLMTCKNVTLAEGQVREKDVKKTAKMGSRAFAFRTITVDALRKSIASGEHGAGHSVMTALRIGRGHWKDYTQGKGLFGRIKGRFWWDSFVTGDDKIITAIRIGDLRRYKVRA